METRSGNTVFSADKVDTATARVKEGASAECNSFISISSRGSSPVVPAVVTHQQAKVI
jgi:hypothetical protein